MAKILLIDDSKLARNLLREILEGEGHTICGEATDGIKGVEKYMKTRPDLVFCDLLMEKMGGLEFLRVVTVEDPKAKVVICTSVGDELHVEELMKAGAKKVIIKPIVTEEVLGVTRMLLGGADSGQKESYKALMERRAAEKGIAPKPVLDFFEAFQKFSGFCFDDPRVDGKYLKENTASVAVGVRALLSPKMSMAEAEQVVDVFQGLMEESEF